MRKIMAILVAAVVALTAAGATVGYAALTTNVQLSVDGTTSEVHTTAGSVGQLLESRGLEVGQHDVVIPTVDTRLAEGARIDVRHGRQVRVTVDGRPQTHWTTATTVEQALAALDLDSPGAEISAGPSTPIGRDGLSFTIATVKTITVVDAGTTRRLETTAQTVGAALAEAKIVVDGDDRLSAGRTARLTDGAALRITRVEVKQVATRAKVDYPTTYSETEDLDEGETEVKTDGRAGVRTVVYSEVRHDGKLRSRERISSKITTAPRAEVVLRGTRAGETSEEVGEQESPGTSGGGVESTAFITGYTYWDNSPPGSAQIARPVLHDRAGGVGTYRDPITVAVGTGSGGPEFAFGTKFYLPDLKKYFIVEDICGACSRDRPGSDYTLDIWLDGRDRSSGAATSCSYEVTGLQPAVRNPSPGLPVAQGSVC